MTNTASPAPSGAPGLVPDTLSEDLAFASRVASEGANTPLFGGPIGVMWGVLISVATSVQYLVLERILEWPPESLLWLWVGFSVSGGLGVLFLSRAQSARPGIHSVGNRVEAAVWTLFAAMTATAVVGIVLNQLFSGGTARLWDFVVVMVFAGQGLAFGVVAKMTALRWLHLASLGSFVFAALSFAVLGSNTLYLVAAVGAVATVVVPSLQTMRAAG